MFILAELLPFLLQRSAKRKENSVGAGYQLGWLGRGMAWGWSFGWGSWIRSLSRISVQKYSISGQ